MILKPVYIHLIIQMDENSNFFENNYMDKCSKLFKIILKICFIWPNQNSKLNLSGRCFIFIYVSILMSLMVWLLNLIRTQGCRYNKIFITFIDIAIVQNFIHRIDYSYWLLSTFFVEKIISYLEYNCISIVSISLWNIESEDNVFYFLMDWVK